MKPTGRFVIYSSHLQDSGFLTDAADYARALQAAYDALGWDVLVEVRRGVTGVGSGWTPRYTEDAADAPLRCEDVEESEARSVADDVLMRLETSK